MDEVQKHNSLYCSCLLTTDTIWIYVSGHQNADLISLELGKQVNKTW